MDQMGSFGTRAGFKSVFWELESLTWLMCSAAVRRCRREGEGALRVVGFLWLRCSVHVACNGASNEQWGRAPHPTLGWMKRLLLGEENPCQEAGDAGKCGSLPTEGAPALPKAGKAAEGMQRLPADLSQAVHGFPEQPRCQRCRAVTASQSLEEEGRGHSKGEEKAPSWKGGNLATR